MKYPMDIDELELGSIITPETIERVMGVSRSEVKKYAIKKMNLAEFIRRQWLEDRGRRCVIKHRGDALHILPHESASRENPSRIRRAIQSWARSHRDNLDVDTAEFTAEQKERHHANLDRFGRGLAMAKKEMRRKLIPEPVKRDQLPPAASKDSDPG